MFAPVRCCFDVMFLLVASPFALSVHLALRPVSIAALLVARAQRSALRHAQKDL